MEGRKIAYVLIMIFCIFAIGVGVYKLVYTEDAKGITYTNTPVMQTNEIKSEEQIENQEEIKTNFTALFTNQIINEGVDISSINKLDNIKDIVFPAYDIKEKKEGKYDMDIHFPVINIMGDVVSKFNDTTQKKFVDKANSIFSDAANNTIYNVDYTAFVVDDILSIAIKSTLKEGGNAQRVIIQTYNYNIKTNKEVTIQEMMALKGITTKQANDKIQRVIKEINKQSESLTSIGYNVYTRDVTDNMYKIDNTEMFMIDNQNNLYIIYPYGNTDFTSEFDIIMF